MTPPTNNPPASDTTATSRNWGELGLSSGSGSSTTVAWILLDDLDSLLQLGDAWMACAVKLSHPLQFGPGIEQFLLLRFHQRHILWRKAQCGNEHLPADDFFQAGKILLQILIVLNRDL